jgi:periplasmic protein TonB
MSYLRLALGHLLCVAFFATAGCRPKPKSEIVGKPPVNQPPASPVPSPVDEPSLSPSVAKPPEKKPEQTPSLDLSRLESSVRPSVIWVTVFDRSGKLLRMQTGFFISGDGRFVTTAETIGDGVNAVAKTADGGIHNVSGILAVSTTLNLAILQADVKRASSLTVNKNANLRAGTPVGVVGSGLAGSEGAPRQTTISSLAPDHLEIAAPISSNSIGSPVVDGNGQLIGVIVSAGEKATVRPSSALDSLLSQITSDAKARWPETAEATPSPRPTPKPRLVYAPAPAFPPEVSRTGVSGSGRFRLSFDARGKVTNIQIIQSTGNRLFDQSAINTLRQWKSAPGREWVATVPVTFQTR